VGMREITPDIAWFIGITIGDGSLSGRMVRLWNNEEFLINKWIEVLNSRFDIPREKIKIRRLKSNRNGFKRNKETIESTVNSTIFKKRIKKLFENVLAASNVNISGPILQGIFDAEGSVNGRCEVVIWQKKDRQGDLITEFMKSRLKEIGIKFVVQNNDNFHIILIPGGFRNHDNIRKFSELIGFSHPKKRKWLDLDLEILSLNRKITEKEMIQFLERVESATVNDMVVNFKVIEHRIRHCLRKLEMKNKIIKTNIWPRRFLVLRAS